ncbi:unnamed protein product [Fusarium venenatum]|uniref:Ubiquitin-like domain-containing protein n=1 Tax=Fusarium venenatum TaxID=56646 RepID=A0A2L2TJV4_9HYPO|nr:uncharacterized protein FVRRES_10465 [Fusarium venenatum]CEI70388.1 unnamed protein product [Fusarium venenatum]
MELALTFGAFGDFIAITVLIKDIITALDDSHGSGKEYRELVQQLNTLRQTLDAVQKSFENPHLTHSLEGISGIMLDTVAQTKKCLVSLLDQIKKYEPTLAATFLVKKTSLNGIRGRVQWKLNKKDIDRFRTELAVHTGALKLVLELAAIKQSAAEGRTAALVRQSEASLERFLDCVGRSIISKLDIIYSLGAQLRISTCQIASMIYSIAGDLNNIKDICMRLDRGPSDEHFILEDITGRVFPIHLKTITSWEILQFILSERFKGKKGARRVQHKRYTLRENKTQRLINRSIPWDSAFLPYQKVNMSLMCNDQNLNLSLSNEAESNCTCVRGALNRPFCKTSLDGVVPLGVETEWEVYLHSSLIRQLTN